MAYTNIFLVNTTMGDASDDDGVFVIDHVPAGSYQLVASRIGCELNIVNVHVAPSKSLELNLHLRVKSIPGEEISIVARQSKQKRDLREFSRYFLGETQNAKKCAILNPEVLSFERASTGDLLASAERPVVVENRALGDKIEILLGSFR